LSSFLFDVVNYHVIICWNICAYAYMLTSTSYTVAKIHERTISLRFLGTILRVLRIEVSGYNVYITNQFLCSRGERGFKSISRGDCEYQGEKLLGLCPNYVQEFGLREELLSIFRALFIAYSLHLSTSLNFQRAYHI
jgi:hypothetical protein